MRVRPPSFKFFQSDCLIAMLWLSTTEKPHETKPLFRTAKLNPDTACFFARKHTHTQTQRREENGNSIIRALWKSGKRLQKNTEKQPCIRKQLPGAAK
jgi:hypothetical protein